MSIATRNKSYTIYCCKTEETCIWHERCLPDAGGTFFTRHCVAMAWFPHGPTDAVTYCILSSRVSKLGNTGYKGAIAQQNGTKDAFTESRERSEMEAAFEKKKIAGSHSWKSSDKKIRDRNHPSLCG